MVFPSNEARSSGTDFRKVFFEFTNSTNSPFVFRIFILLIPFSAVTNPSGSNNEMSRSTAAAEIFGCSTSFTKEAFYASVGCACFNTVLTCICSIQKVILVNGNIKIRTWDNKLLVILTDHSFYLTAFIKDENNFVAGICNCNKIPV